ncbi:MAG TPA: nitroreductase [Pseudomonadales bacterium]|nr:nitroreductase [Pseudomonadales bacterium]
MTKADESVSLPGATADGKAALRLLLTRYSVSPKHLGEPGPSEDELWTMAMAALRAPDHNKRIPYRFVVARGDGLERLAALFEDYGRRRGKSGEELARERERAMQAPVVIAVIARIDPHDEEVPPHEQWASVGGAISNALSALHFMGYAGKMVSGLRAADPAIVAAYCGEGETLVGWISAGTPRGPAKPRGEVDADGILSDF